MSLKTTKYDFTGKVALVTGSSNGIGAIIALQLAKYGANVTITGRSAETLAKVAEQIVKFTGRIPLQIVGDLLDDTLPPKLINETTAKFGQLDIVVNNAGMASMGGHLASPECMNDFDRIMKVNLRSVVQLTQLAVPHLEKTKGNIINISSVASFKPFPGTLIYGALKAALDMVTKCSALELGPKGIRVNSINPGPVSTAFIRDMKNTELIKSTMATYAEMTVLKRLAVPGEIANLASFLASDDAKNITGSIMVNDGGML